MGQKGKDCYGLNHTLVTDIKGLLLPITSIVKIFFDLAKDNTWSPTRINLGPTPFSYLYK